MSRKPGGNGTNYYRKVTSPGLMPYRKHVNWKKRQSLIPEEGFDNEASRGIVRLPEPLECLVCDRKVVSIKARNTTDE